MEIVTGPPVVGEKFFGREKELQRMYEKITKTDASLFIPGSINVLSTARDMNVTDLINDLTDIDILQLSDMETREFLTQLLSSKGIKLEKSLLQFAVKRLNDGIPFYIQLFADGVSQYTNSNSQISEEKDIKELYDRITNKSHKEFENFHSRLTEYLNSTEANIAQTILAHLANNPLPFEELYSYSERLIADKQKFHRITSRLVDENYIKSENEIYSFVSPMLKDWWKNKYGWEKD